MMRAKRGASKGWFGGVGFGPAEILVTLTVVTVVFGMTLMILIVKSHQSYEASHTHFQDSFTKNQLIPEPVVEKAEPDLQTPKPIVAKPDRVLNEPTIFIAMPAFDERDCVWTVQSAYEQAEYPDRIFFGIYQQTGSNTYDCTEWKDITCPDHPVCNRMWQIRINRVEINSDNSRGPTHARWNALKHYRNEDFIFVTDSHTRFRKNWDSVVIDYWKMTKNPYAVLTHYPKGTDSSEAKAAIAGEKGRRNPPAYGICGTYFEMPPNWMPRNANGCYIHGAKEPIMTPFWCAGFSFMPRQANEDVPWDPHTEYMFWGEEFSYGSRLWTAGYDFYVPHEDVAFHRYSPDKEHSRGNINKVWKHDTAKIRDRGEKRINKLWGLLDIRTPNWKEEDINLDEYDKFGLGTRRSLDDYWKFAGINIKTREFKIFKQEEYRKGLTRIPWKENDPLS